RLIGRLEEEGDAAGEIGPATRENAGHSSNDGRVDVVAATVIATGVERRVGSAGRFVHVDGVHVGANEHSRPGPAALEQAEDAGAADAFGDGKAEVAQVGGEACRCPRFLEGELRVLVKLTTEGDCGCFETADVGADVCRCAHGTPPLLTETV